MKPAWLLRKELNAMQDAATEAYLQKLCDEVFQKGVERGAFDERMKVRQETASPSGQERSDGR